MAFAFADMVLNQLDVFKKITGAFENYNKKSNKTLGNCESHIEQLNVWWNKYCENDRILNSLKTDENKEDEYFVNPSCKLNVIEEVYMDQKGEFLQFKFDLASNSSLNTNSNQNTIIVSDKTSSVPIPTFSGDIREWISYRDLFYQLVVNTNKSSAEKLTILKSSLKGQPLHLIKNLSVSEGKFKEEIWQKLLDQYDNNKYIIYSHVNTLLNIKGMTAGSDFQLRKLINDTMDSVDSLKRLGAPTEHWGYFLVPLTVNRLDSQTRRDWEDFDGDFDVPSSFDELRIFLDKRLRTLSMMQQTSGSSRKLQQKESSSNNNGQGRINSNINNYNQKSNNIKAHNVNKDDNKSNNSNNLLKNTKCFLCNENHFISYCNLFKEKSVNERLDFVKVSKLCLNCLGKHLLKDCRNKKTCSKCNERHHTFIHEAITKSSQQTSFEPGFSNNSDISGVNASTTQGYTAASTSARAAHISTVSTVLLGTAVVVVSSDHGIQTFVRALIDPGSEVSFISENLAHRLKLRRDSSKIPISGVGNSTAVTRGLSTVNVKSRFDESYMYKVDVFILYKLTSYTPKFKNIDHDWSVFSSLPLADPHFSSDAEIEMIIGADLYPLIMLEGLVKGPENSLAQNTAFGWIITCSFNNKDSEIARISQHISLVSSQNQMLNDSIQKFWQLESVPVPHSIDLLSSDDRECHQHFLDTYSRDENGRFMVRLPFKSDRPAFHGSFNKAKMQFIRLINKISKNERLKTKYFDFMLEFEELAHMRKLNIDVSKSELFDDLFVIPHHGVIQNEKKLRVVFNASAPDANGLSLNDTLFSGPALQTDITFVLMRWRCFRYALKADIQKMYRQILMHPDDRKYQSIIWGTDPKNFSIYELATVTYGVVLSAYQAIACLHQLALLEGERFPQAAELVKNNMYVDDAHFGADSLLEAIQLSKEFTQLLNAGGFPLRKWASNDNRLLDHLPEEWLDETTDSCVSCLGMSWNNINDTLSYINVYKADSITLTKRAVLSIISKLYDPLGLLSPITIRSKIFMQLLWQEKLDWDDSLPEKLSNQFLDLYQDLRLAHSIAIPRWINFYSGCTFEIHAFADASTKAKATVVYFRIMHDGHSSVNLVIAKSKVAPLKTISVSRLELCAARLMCNLVSKLIECFKIENINIHLWSDSRNALAWILSPPHLWQTFVAHRVADIQRLVPQAYWHHIDGEINPADLPSRGVATSEISNSSIWWSGPEFLSNNSDPYPQENEKISNSECLERRRTTHLVTADPKEEWDLLCKFSSLSKLLKVTAWCFRFINNIRSKKSQSPSFLASYLTPNEILNVENFWARHTQTRHFPKEYHCLLNGKEIGKSSPLFRLNVYFDDSSQLIRINGRLKHADLNFGQKYPIVLPNKSKFSALIIQDRHLKSLQGGVQLTLSFIRLSFWIIQARRAVSSHIQKCISCLRFRASSMSQKMADLPFPRVNPSPPFSHVGVDYAGPIWLRTTSGRGHKSYKGYIAVFVCFSTKAIHLEVVSSYDTKHFMLALKRFIARRGLPSNIYSDCGTNFIGANNEIQKLFTQGSSFSNELLPQVTSYRINWHFNPPASPHFGGLWEAAVKSTKFHIKRVIGENTLTFEEMSTLLASVEICVNSRPLCPLSDDPTDLNFLTPSHLLIGRSLLSIPDEETIYQFIGLNRRWKLLIQMRDDFWSTWHRDYLQYMNQRTKWNKAQPNITVGSMVIIRAENVSPSRWPVGRVIDVHPGQDGLVRVATIKTPTSIIKRSVVKLILLFSD